MKRLKQRQKKITKAQTKELAKSDLAFFCENILWKEEIEKGDYYLTDYHREWSEELQKFMFDDEEQLFLIAAPRGSIKTGFVTVAFTIQQIIRNPNIRILITNETEPHAKKFLKEIKNHLEDNKILKGLYGEFKSKKKWSGSAIEIQQRTIKSKEPTIEIGSLETSSVSAHYDLIIHDDLHSRQNVMNTEQIDKVEQYYKDSYSLLEPDGKMILVFTRWHYDDIYGRILSRFTEKDTINGKPATDGVKEKWAIDIE